MIHLKCEMAYLERVVVLIDMDCFYCQVEEKLDRDLEGKPIAVVQYNEWRGGGIIAVNYPARDKGVTRHMRGDEAKAKCPEIVLARVPQIRGKADLSKYREAGKRVAEVLQKYTNLLERASIDEAYLDITEAVKNILRDNYKEIHIGNLQNTFVVGSKIEDFIENIHKNQEFSEDKCRLAMGGIIVEEIRRDVVQKTGYKCSAGIAHNKILAKLACGLHKPNKQTILPHDGVVELYKDLPIRKIKSLGGKFGSSLSEDLQITYMGQLAQFSEQELIRKFDEKTGHWLYNIARGIDLDPVVTRLVSKSIGCCKRFPGKTALITNEDIAHWMNELASEISERLTQDFEENNRKAKQMVISFGQIQNSKTVHSSRTHPLNSYDAPKIAQDGLDVLRKFCRKPDGSYHITFLGISVGNFQENKKTKDISSFFRNMVQKSEQLESYSEGTDTDLSSALVDVSSSNITFDMNGDECDSDSANNESIYSATTEEMDDDIESLIYYEDIYPECVSSQPLNNVVISKEMKSTTVGSMNPSTPNEDVSNLRKSSSQSFFAKYFQRCPTDDSRLSTGSSNMDSSETVIASSNIVDSEESCNVVDETKDSFEMCSECKKLIPITDVLSHKDYHFAVKLMEDETRSYKQPSNKSLSKSHNQILTKSTKNSNKQSVLSLLHNRDYSDLDDNNSAVCSFCNRRIKFENYSNHMDYHASKALLVEDSQKEKKDIIQVRGVKRQSSSNSIMSLFNKTDKLDETNSVYCSKCNKRIKLNNAICHDDYHIAKELTRNLDLDNGEHHHQLPQTETTKSVKKKSNNNIRSFFKSSM